MAYAAPSMTDGVTQLNKSNLQGWLQVVGDRPKALIDITWPDTNLGAVAGGPAAANRLAIQNALNMAADGGIIIPAGTFDINAPLGVPSRCTVYLYGKVQAASGFGPASPVFKVYSAGARNSNAIIMGGGQILCNRVAGYGIELSSSHGFRATNLEINDAITASVHVWADEAPAVPGNSTDCDDFVFDQLTHRTNSGATFGSTPTSPRPLRFALVEKGSQGGTADGTFSNCYVEGLSHLGGWGFELVDCSRILIDGKCISDNGRQYSGGVLMRHVYTGHSQERNMIRNLYVEAQHGGPSIGVKIDSSIGAVANMFSRYHIIDGLAYATDVAGAAGQRLVMTTTTAGKVIQNQYINPRGVTNTNGQLNLDVGCNQNYIEQLDALTRVGVNDGNVIDNGTNNKIVHLLA